ncbi:MAG: hypothetical protein KAH17_10215 [Bacteroidales bacterium]|nr:hypothetical protein [Bacteroidales bacterium]
MRGLFVVFFLMLFGTVTVAQNAKVLAAWNSMKPKYNDLDKAMEAIDAAALHPKTSKVARTWYYRGKCYHKLHNTTVAKYKSLSPNPLKIAYKSYVIARNLDTMNNYPDIEFKLKLIGAELFNRGAANYHQKKFRESLEAFEMALTINALPFINQVDAEIVFYAAIAADQAGLYDKALSYYHRSIELKSHGSDVYHYVAKVFMAKGDTAHAIKSYEDGIIAFPDDNGYLYIQLINYYLQQEDIDKVVEYVEPAVEKNSENASLWNVYGTAFEDTDQEKASIGFINAIEQDSTFFEPYYNIGTLYYNQGVDAYDVAKVIPLDRIVEYNAAISKRDKFFALALPYYEKAVEIDSNSSDLLIALKEIYIRLKMQDQLTEVTELIEGLR